MMTPHIFSISKLILILTSLLSIDAISDATSYEMPYPNGDPRNPVLLKEQTKILGRGIEIENTDGSAPVLYVACVGPRVPDGLTRECWSLQFLEEYKGYKYLIGPGLDLNPDEIKDGISGTELLDRLMELHNPEKKYGKLIDSPFIRLKKRIHKIGKRKKDALTRRGIIDWQFRPLGVDANDFYEIRSMLLSFGTYDLTRSSTEEWEKRRANSLEVSSLTFRGEGFGYSDTDFLRSLRDPRKSSWDRGEYVNGIGTTRDGWELTFEFKIKDSQFSKIGETDPMYWHNEKICLFGTMIRPELRNPISFGSICSKLSYIYHESEEKNLDQFKKNRAEIIFSARKKKSEFLFNGLIQGRDQRY